MESARKVLFMNPGFGAGQQTPPIKPEEVFLKAEEAQKVLKEGEQHGTWA